MASGVSTVQKSYIELRGLNLGMTFLRENDLKPGTKYDMVIEDLPEVEIEGTLDPSGFIGGLSRLYREYDLEVGDKVEIDFDGTVIRLRPPVHRRHHAGPAIDVPEDQTKPVFERQGLKHIHIEPYAPGNLSKWVPQTEADVYMVFGALSEYTDYQYCCGASKALIDNLGYQADTRPDAVLIERATSQYVMAEFKMNSKEFALNHKQGDVDVLICWDDNETDRSRLPPAVVGLRALLEKAISEGDIGL